MSHNVSSDILCPHAPDVIERETADNGFSKGWGMHFKPMESHIIDVHGHIQFTSFCGAQEHIRKHLALVNPINVSHCVVCSPVMTKPEDKERPQGFNIICISGMDELKPYIELAKQSGRLSMMLFLHYDNPDIELLKQSAAEGICAVKLHNAPMIVEAGDPKQWLGDDWAAMFRVIEKLELPILWHVTQRLTDCPYTGGGRNTYWKEGWKRGLSCTNEDFLQIYLKVVENHPGIRFISAHQLHLGWERLSRLFDQYPNLYIDTSIGCVVREGDWMYEEDIRTIRDIFIRHSDRMLFGTDSFITDLSENSVANADDEKLASARNHIRFIKQLRLPDDALQSVFHGNAEKILRLPVSKTK
jgi:predicted TIM-barrel fold metal-dependent hydrolase